MKDIRRKIEQALRETSDSIFYHGTSHAFDKLRGVTFVTTNKKEAENFACKCHFRGPSTPIPPGARVMAFRVKGRYLTLRTTEADAFEKTYGVSLGKGRSASSEIINALEKADYSGLERVMDGGVVRMVINPLDLIEVRNLSYVL